MIQALERYTVRLYGGDESCTSADEARKSLFSSGDRPLTSIFPTRAALVQHIKRAAYQAGHIWGRCSELGYKPAPPDQWGWHRKDGTLQPYWCTLPCIWKACRELDRCGCASNCSTQRCLCRRYQFHCCTACKKCHGECSNKRLVQMLLH